MTKICDLCPSAKIDIIPNYGVSDIRKMRNGCIFSNHRIFYFYKCSNLGILINTRIPTNICIWSDNCIFSYKNITNYICARLDNCSFFQFYFPINCYMWFNNCSFFYIFYFIISNYLISRFEKIPWISDCYPFSLGFNGMIFSSLNI